MSDLFKAELIKGRAEQPVINIPVKLFINLPIF